MKTDSPNLPHKAPKDLLDALTDSKVASTAWKDITPLARNEFICWVTSTKQDKTRARRIEVAIDKLEKGERRPCCWIGCTHRTDKPMSRSQKYILEKRSKK